VSSLAALPQSSSPLHDADEWFYPVSEPPSHFHYMVFSPELMVDPVEPPICLRMNDHLLKNDFDNMIHHLLVLKK